MLCAVDDRPRRIVLITERFPTPSETFIFQRFTRLLDRGWDMHVVCTESRSDEVAMFDEFVARPEIRGRIHVRPARHRRVLAAIMFPIVLLRMLLRVPRATVRYLAHSWRANRTGIVRRLPEDRALVELAPDVVHFTFGWFALGRGYLRDALGTDLVVSFQGADINYAGIEQDPGYYDDVWRFATRVHFLSEDLRRRAISRGYAPDGRDVVVTPGTDLERFAPAPREREPGEPLRILSVGRLHWKKGHEYALEAVRMLRDRGIDVRFHIVGDGPHREAIAYTIHDLGLQDVVTLLGSQPASRTKDEMQWADVLLHASVSEGFCYAAVEAQAMALPVVTSDADGLPENVEDEVSGFVVRRRDADALVRALTTLACDPQLRRTMGEAGRSRAVERFAVNAEIDGFEALYRSLSAPPR